MFLRRLTKYVTEQNWVAVLIEFVLVVLGVYIGLYLGNWNEDRQDEELYNEAFGRVIVELEMNLMSVEADQVALRERLPVVQRAIADLRACETGPDAEANVQAAFGPLEWEIEFILDTHALEQLIANEIFLPFQDAETRQVLMELLSYLHQLQRYSIEINDDADIETLDAWGAIAPGELTYETPEDVIAAFEAGDLEGSSIWRETVLTVPLEDACRDPSLMAQFYLWEVSAYWHSVAAHNLSGTLRADLERLGHPVEPAETGAAGSPAE